MHGWEKVERKESRPLAVYDGKHSYITVVPRRARNSVSKTPMYSLYIYKRFGASDVVRAFTIKEAEHWLRQFLDELEAVQQRSHTNYRRRNWV